MADQTQDSQNYRNPKSNDLRGCQIHKASPLGEKNTFGGNVGPLIIITLFHYLGAIHFEEPPRLMI
jgi:hypothetical protein